MTQPQEMEEQLRASEAQFRAVFDNCPDGILIADAQTKRFVACNAAASQMLGYTPEEIPSLGVAHLHPADAVPDVADQFEKLARGEINQTLDIPVKRKDGTVFRAEIRAFPITLAGRNCVAGLFRDISERQRAAAALQESEARYRELVENHGEGLGIVDPEERFTFVNPAGEQIFGVPPGGLAGRTLKEFLTPDQYARVLEETRNRRAGQKSTYELEIVRPEGETRCLLITAAPRTDTAGQYLGAFGLFRDITEQRRAEQRLRDRAEIQRVLLNAVQESLFLLDPQGVVLVANETLARRWGRSVAELVGRSIFDLMPPDLAASRKAHIETAVRERRLVRFEDVRAGQNMESFIYPSFDAAGTVTTLGVFGMDVTERKRAEVALEASEKRFRTLFESAPVAMALHGADGQYLRVNRAYQGMLGYSQEELLRLGPGRVTHPEDVAEGRRHYQELCAGQRDHYGREKRYVRPDGRLVWGRAANAAVRNSAGRLDFIVSVVEDVTAQKRAAGCSAAFARLGQELSATTTPGQAAHLIVRTASDLLGWDACYVYLHSPEQAAVLPVLAMDIIDGFRAEVPPEILGASPAPLTAEVMEHGARLINRDAAGPSAAAPFPFVPFGDKSRPSASIMGVPIRHGAKALGVLSIQSYTPQAYREEDLALLQTLADHCGGALERVHAAAQLKRLEAEILEISAREQRRVGFELHDGLGQTLGGIALKAKLLEQSLREELLPRAPEAAALVKLLNKAMGDTRRLARGLAPTDLELSGLPAAIEQLACEIEASSGIRCLVTCHPSDLQLPPAVALHLYRIAQEALHNAVEHGEPRQIKVTLTVNERRLRLQVRDDGRGFAPNAPVRPGMGLNIMRYRTNSIGGELTLRSEPNQGTEVRCVLRDAAIWESGRQPECP